MMTNLLPHSSALEDIGVTVRLIQRVPPADEGQLPEHEGIREVLAGCWHIDPAKRPRIGECRDRLSNFVLAAGKKLSLVIVTSLMCRPRAKTCRPRRNFRDRCGSVTRSGSGGEYLFRKSVCHLVDATFTYPADDCRIRSD